MIHLIDNFYVDVDPYNYTLIVDYGKTDKKGRPMRKSIGYYGSLVQAVKACIEEYVRRGFYDRCVELEEAVDTLSERLNVTDELVKRCLPEVELK